MLCVGSCTKRSVILTAHLVESKVTSHIYSSCASKDNNEGRDEIHKRQDELKNAEWLAEAKSVYIESHGRHGKHLQAGNRFVLCDKPCQCTRAWCEFHMHTIQLQAMCMTWYYMPQNAGTDSSFEFVCNSHRTGTICMSCYCTHTCPSARSQHRVMIGFCKEAASVSMSLLLLLLCVPCCDAALKTARSVAQV